MSLQKPGHKSILMPNVTIRAKKEISSSTSKLIKPKYLPRTASVSSLRECKSRSVNCQNKNVKYRKSVSLQDLSAANQKNINLKRQLFHQMENEQITSPLEMECLLHNNEKNRKLAMKTYVAFLRNALKKVAQRSAQQTSSISTLNAQVKNTKMQICTLKSLLCSDEQFRRDCIVEHYKLKKKVEAVTNERDELRIENHHLETNLEQIKEELNATTVELLNEKNSLQQFRSEATALEVQLEKEREKIKTLKNELKKANDKEQMLEKALETGSKDIDSLSVAVRDLEIQISSQLGLLKLSEEKLADNNQKLKEGERKVKSLKTELELLKVTVASLSKDKNYLIKEIDEKNSKFKSIEKAYKEQTIHMIELKTTVMALEAQTFSSKFVSLASSLMKVPIAFLNIMSSQS